MKPKTHRISTSILIVLNCFIVISMMKTLKTQDPLATGKFMSFDQFKVKYNKNYHNASQTAIRNKAYNANLASLASSNCTTCDVTSFFDKTSVQLQNLCGSNLKGVKFSDNSATVNIQAKVAAPPVSFDWRSLNAVTPVKDQGNCGSCWAFATVAQFESDMVLKGQKDNTIDLAEQILLNCDKNSAGCNGGNCVSASNLVISKGLSNNSLYSYNPTATYPGICTNVNQYSFLTEQLSYYYKNTKLSTADIITRLLVKPQMIYVTATTWYTYPSNTTKIFSCSKSDSTKPSTLNHAVLLVGYTSDSWIIKNSWGTSFGNGGYISVTNNPTYNCGIGFFVASSN